MTAEKPLHKRHYQLSPQLLLPWHPGRTTSTMRAAELLGCSESTVIRMVQDGSLEGFKKRRRNSPYLIIYESILRVADEWRRQAGLPPVESASPAAAPAAAPAGAPRRL